MQDQEFYIVVPRVPYDPPQIRAIITSITSNTEKSYKVEIFLVGVKIGTYEIWDMNRLRKFNNTLVNRARGLLISTAAFESFIKIIPQSHPPQSHPPQVLPSLPQPPVADNEPALTILCLPGNRIDLRF